MRSLSDAPDLTPMNNQLQQLETRVTALVAQFKTLADEKQALADEVVRLREQQQRMVQEFNADQTVLTQKHELHAFHLEQNLQQMIDELRQENAQYQQLLAQSARDIGTLLKRLPATMGKEAE